MERCPGCRARLGEYPVCSRCGCDLTHVFRAEARAAHLMRCAMHAWAAGNRDAARVWMQKSLALEHKPLGDLLCECLASPSTEEPKGRSACDVSEILQMRG